MEWSLLHALIIGIAIPVALFYFYRAVDYKYRLMRAGQPVPDPIEDHGVRRTEVLKIFLGQKKLFQEYYPGVMHALIFWGFMVLLLRALTLFGMAFAGFDFHFPFLGTNTITGRIYSLTKDLANVTVAAMIILALYRRYVTKIPRLKNTSGALFVLLMILGLMISDMIFDGAMHAFRTDPFHGYAPVGSGLGLLLRADIIKHPGIVAAAGHLGYLAHCLGILVFLVYLPAGKHMHILTSVFNVYLRPLHRDGRLTKLDLEDESIESFGAARIEDHTWKDILDMYTCTECGRCNDVCPAHRTGKKLAPREITDTEKHFLVDEEAGRLLNGDAAAEPSRELVPDVITPEEIWACTTCMSCEQACPLNIGYVQRINSLRRSEVLNKGQFPSELKRVFRGMENNSNPWGMGASKRMDWARDLDLPEWDDTDPPDYLLYIGCAVSFDDRAQAVARKLVGILRQAGIRFAVLGADEQCCGETARRLGEEALGQMLIEGNMELFRELGVRKILTLCPHCYNTFKNEYPDFGATFEVVHHSRLLAELLRDGTLAADRLETAATLHDSCYLGRVNGEYESSRQVVRSACGGDFRETAESREKGFCCGAGGGMFWLEEQEPRINHERVKQLMAGDPDLIVTSCPYCLRMLEDGIRDLGHDSVHIRDIAELISDPAAGDTGTV